jgi:hypothetical protein
MIGSEDQSNGYVSTVRGHEFGSVASLEILRDFTDEALEGEFANEEFG